MDDKLYSIILAAGEGKRMKSKLPKPLQKACGRALIDYVCDAARAAGAEKSIVIIGHGAEQMREYLGDSVEYAEQKERLGTGHAVMQGIKPIADKCGTVIILSGDVPLVTADMIQNAYSEHLSTERTATVVTAIADNPFGYGRVIRCGGEVEKIVEEKDASPDEKAVCEINSGIYLFDIQKLKSALGRISNDNSQGEYYLTDVLGILKGDGEKIGAFITDLEQILGVNDKIQLAEIDKILNSKNVMRLMRDGARILNPETVRADSDVIVGADTVIYPNTILEGKCVIGEDCVIGPNTRLVNTVVGDATEVQSSVAIDSRIGRNTAVGPFAYLRPNSNVGNDVKVGDFVEVKNSNVGNGTKIAHLTYVGDADVGKRVNFGCGTVIVNYDGINKHRTIIEDDCFIGCNSNLVSPVTLHKGAYTAAGSTITDEVPKDALAIARARQVVKENWAKGKTKNNR